MKKKQRLFSFNNLDGQKEQTVKKNRPMAYSQTLKLRQKYKFWPFLPEIYTNTPVPPPLNTFLSEKAPKFAIGLKRVETNKVVFEDLSDGGEIMNSKGNFNSQTMNGFSSNYEATLKRRATRKRINFKEKVDEEKVKELSPPREFFAMKEVAYQNYKYPKTDCLLVKRKRFTNILLDKVQPLHSNIEACIEHMKEKEEPGSGDKLEEKHFYAPYDNRDSEEMMRKAKTHLGFNLNSSETPEMKNGEPKITETPIKISVPPRTSTNNKRRHKESEWIFSKISNTKEVIIANEFERLSELTGEKEKVSLSILKSELLNTMNPIILDRVILALGFNPSENPKFSANSFSRILKYTVLRKISVREMLDFLVKFFSLGDEQVKKNSFLRLLRILCENFEEEGEMVEGKKSLFEFFEENFHLTEVIKENSEFADIDKFRAAFLSLQMNPHDIYELIFSPVKN